MEIIKSCNYSHILDSYQFWKVISTNLVIFHINRYEKEKYHCLIFWHSRERSFRPLYFLSLFLLWKSTTKKQDFWSQSVNPGTWHPGPVFTIWNLGTSIYTSMSLSDLSFSHSESFCNSVVDKRGYHIELSIVLHWSMPVLATDPPRLPHSITLLVIITPWLW